MKVSQHVEHLLRQGRSPKDLLELGFPKRVVTRVRKQLREEKAAQQVKAARGRGKAIDQGEPSVDAADAVATLQQKLVALESNLKELHRRVEGLEATGAEDASLAELEARLNGTPILGLRQRFKCDCGASGFVATHIQCTKCGRETWWGWFPKQ